MKKVVSYLLITMMLIFTACNNNQTKEDLYYKREYQGATYGVIEYSDRYDIVRVDKKGKYKVIYSTDKIYDFVIENGILYFADKDYNICTIDKNGRNYSVVFNCRRRIGEIWSLTYLIVRGSDIYVRVNSFELYVCDTISETVRELTYDAREIEVAEQYLLYSGKASHTVYKLDFATKEAKPFVSARAFKIIGGNVYYLGVGGGIIDYNADKMIDDSEDINPDSLCEYDGSLYYVKKPDGYILVKYDGNKITTVTELDDYNHGGSISDGYFVYYYDHENTVSIKI